MRTRHPNPSLHAVVGVLLTAATAAAPSPAAALGLGGVIQQSALGQPLRLVVEVIAAPGDDLSSECFRIAPPARESDGIPQIAFARVVPERTPSGAQLLIANTRPVNDPVVRVSVQAGCDQSIRRDYTLLMDPLPIDPPLSAADSGAVAAPAAPAPAVVAPVAAPPAPAATAAEPAPAAKKAPARRKPAARRPAVGPGALPPRAGDATTATPEAVPPAAGRAAASGARRDAPRLRISGAPPTSGGPTAGQTEAARNEAQAQAELAQALEAETVVLRQRIAELSAMVERMDQEIRAASAARLAAEEAAKASPMAVATRWWEANWPILAAITGLAALVAGGLLLRRRRVPVPTGEWPITRARDDRFPHSALYEPVAGSMTQGGADEPTAARAPEPEPGRRRPDAAHAVAVSELSQITEEARVYLTLGHVERAMAVLREHIAEQPGAAPAAWLMLLDLYRVHGKEKEFRKLAEEFHQRFNVQTPQWDSFHEQQHDLGLLGFPHIVEQLTKTWRTEDCRSYLERLLFDNRQGRRMGFSLAAYSDVLLLRQMLEVLLADRDDDGTEEAKLRAAWAAAQGTDTGKPGPYRRATMVDELGSIGGKPESPPRALPAMLELDLELDLDQAGPDTELRCRLEIEHPGLLRELSRQWGRPAAAALLHEITSGQRPVTPPLSAEAAAEVVLLRGIADEIAPAGRASRR